MTQSEPRASAASPARNSVCIWLTLEAPEVIEVKRVVLDRDPAMAVDFFERVIVPRVLDGARRRGMENALSGNDGPDEHLPG